MKRGAPYTPRVAEFGAVLPEPGGEAAWLEQLPGELREKLKAAA